MKAVRVALGDRSYHVRFGPLGPAFGSAVAKLGFKGRRALVVSTRSVIAAGHAATALRALKAAGILPRLVALPDGESHKTLATVAKIHAAGFAAGLDRKSLIVAVGGGVVTDMAGFVAATYMRGIALVSVPTTLLAMVDAAIGGKTGVDTPEGKNLVGAFWQPALVWIDPSVLRSLPDRQWRNGFAEIAKYGVIKDRPFFEWLERRVRARPRLASWTERDVSTAIGRSVAIKALVVSADEREAPLGGGREVLNFGHTAGHALEAATGYRTMSHGEAISVGMAVAGEIALGRRAWSRREQDRMKALLLAAGLPVRFPRLSAAEKRRFWEALRRDKKNVDARLRFVLPRSLGRVEVRSGIDLAEIRRAARCCGL